MDCLELQNRSGYSKVIFSDDEILLYKKDREIVIPIACIEKIEYAKPSLINYFLAVFGGTYPGRFVIYLNKKIQTTKLYLVKIKEGEVLCLPEIYRNRLEI